MEDRRGNALHEDGKESGTRGSDAGVAHRESSVGPVPLLRELEWAASGSAVVRAVSVGVGRGSPSVSGYVGLCTV